MKKIIGSFTLLVVFAASSCADNPTEVKKEVIVVPAPQTTIIKEPARPTTVIKETERPAPTTPSTKIILNKEGAKVSTKKVEVTINKP
ncbi:MAG: hypothetical protein H7178_00265 [Chitinophagaceae bacterium]|nr:hypothetical protein [Chitinophagaceae bacterium]